MTQAPSLAGLVASRICHDLISPVGAIGNGMELLRSGGGDEEMALIEQCAAAANAALKFMRIAFGARDPADMIPSAEVASVVADYLGGKRVTTDWRLVADRGLPFAVAQPLAWLALVGATALPRGGALRLSRAAMEPLDIEWELDGEVKMPPRMLDLLAAPPVIAKIAPGEVHVLMLWRAAAECDGRLRWSPEEFRLALR